MSRHEIPKCVASGSGSLMITFFGLGAIRKLEDDPDLVVVEESVARFGSAGWGSVGLKTWIIRTLSGGFVGERPGLDDTSDMVIAFFGSFTLMVRAFFF